jgi:hypothetical protein
MTVPQGMTDVLQRLDDDQNKLAAVVKDLRDRVKTDMTPEEVTAVQGKLGEIAAHMEATGQDPNNPVPTPAPQPLSLSSAAQSPQSPTTKPRARGK